MTYFSSSYAWETYELDVWFVLIEPLVVAVERWGRLEQAAVPMEGVEAYLDLLEEGEVEVSQPGEEWAIIKQLNECKQL